MAANRPDLRIEPLGASHLDAAAALLADRHRRHRAAEPSMDPAYEDVVTARQAIEAALAAPSADGFVAWAGEVVGYLVGSSKDAATWGPNVWVESAGHAATDGSVVRALYREAAAGWVAAGRTNHHVLVPASDAALVEAWFALDFGQQHLHAARELGPGSGIVPASELIVRRATLDDVESLVDLELVLPEHLRASPVFSPLPPESREAVRESLAADVGGSPFEFFVAEQAGRVIGSSIGCALTQSGGNAGLIRPPDAAFLAYAAVLPETRGAGAGRALAEAVLEWARDAGYTWIATDWRSTNLEADGAWRGMGFRPTFRRLHRLIG